MTLLCNLAMVESNKIPFQSIRGMFKNLQLLRRVGNSGRPWVHVAMCDNTYSDISMIIHGDSCFNLVKSTTDTGFT